MTREARKRISMVAAFVCEGGILKGTGACISGVTANGSKQVGQMDTLVGASKANFIGIALHDALDGEVVRVLLRGVCLAANNSGGAFAAGVNLGFENDGVVAADTAGAPGDFAVSLTSMADVSTTGAVMLTFGGHDTP